MKFFVLFCRLFLSTFLLQAQHPRSGPVPSWVTFNPINYSANNNKNADGGFLYLAAETQTNVALQTTYSRRVIRLVTEAGMQNVSKVSVQYDPSYQKVIFHTVQIIRNGQVLNRLDLSKIRLIHQEKELSRSIYNGDITALYFLEDVRKGDVVEFAYSVQGENPVFGGKYAGMLELQYEFPVQLLFYKVICPVNRPLQIKKTLTKTALIQNQTIQGADNVYSWKLTNLPALPEGQDQLPDWYDNYPVLFISEYHSWKEVNDWAMELFRTQTPLSAELKQEIIRIKSAAPAQEQQIIAALRFVQDEVRYLGIEMGSNSHRPHNPNTIFHQRFGDCKDKTLLLCTMLRALNVEAHPVLINTDAKHELTNWLPSSYAFNHATVQVRFRQKTYWFDPTISLQRGQLGDVAFPDYQCGLVLTDSTTGLTTIPLQETGKVYTKTVFRMKDLSGPASMDITTTYTGSYADDMRYEANNNSWSQLQKNYLDFVRNYYDGSRVRDILQIEDNDSSGNIITHEFYTVKNLWSLEKGVRQACFYGATINGLIKKPEDRERTMPIAITYPAHYIEDVEIHLPDAWQIDKSPSVVLAPAYHFRSSITSRSDSIVFLHYDYESLQDYVAVKDAASYLQDCEDLGDDIGYKLSSNEHPLSGTLTSENSQENLDRIEVIIVGLLISVAVYMQFRKNRVSRRS